MNAAENVRVNRLPAKTWYHLNVNDRVIEGLRGTVPAEVELSGDGVVGTALGGRTGMALRGILGGEHVPESGCGADFTEWLRRFARREILIGVQPHVRPVRVRITGAPSDCSACGYAASCEAGKMADPKEDQEGVFQAAELFIEAEEGEDVTVLVELFDRDESEASETIVPRRIALNVMARLGRKARVKLVEVSLGKAEDRLLSSIGVLAGEDAHFELDQIFLGTKESVAGNRIELRGDRASSETHVAYIVPEQGRLDLSYVIPQLGKRTDSETTLQGALYEGAEKTLRATIDFKNGASGSTGSENEDVLLFGDNVMNRTVPLILCTEEDVQGSHGATIGRIDEEMLFYLESRGLSAETAALMMRNARVEVVLQKILDGRIASKVLGELKND